MEVDTIVNQLVDQCKSQNIIHLWALLRRYSAGAISERFECIPVHIKTFEEKYKEVEARGAELAKFATLGGVSDPAALQAAYAELGIPETSRGETVDVAISAVEEEMMVALNRLQNFQLQKSEWRRTVFEQWNAQNEYAMAMGYEPPPIPQCRIPDYDVDEWNANVKDALQRYAAICSDGYAFKLWDVIPHVVAPEELTTIRDSDAEYLETIDVIQRSTLTESRVAKARIMPWFECVRTKLEDERDHDDDDHRGYERELKLRLEEREKEILMEKRFRLIRERLICPSPHVYAINSQEGRQALGRLAIVYAYRHLPQGKNLNHWLIGSAVLDRSSEFVLVFNSTVVSDQYLNPFLACILYILNAYEGFWDTWSSLWRQVKPRSLHVAQTCPHWTRDAPARMDLYRRVMQLDSPDIQNQIPMYTWARQCNIDPETVTEVALIAFDFMNHQEGRLALGLCVSDRQGVTQCNKKWVRVELAQRKEAWAREMAYRRDVLNEIVPTAIKPVITDVYNPEWAAVKTIQSYGRLACPIHE